MGGGDVAGVDGYEFDVSDGVGGMTGEVVVILVPMDPHAEAGYVGWGDLIEMAWSRCWRLGVG